MSNRIQQLYELGQSVWCDHLSRGMIASGELDRLIGLGVVGITSNPTIFMKAVTSGRDYDDRLTALPDDLSDMDAYEALVLPDIRDAADRLRQVYDRTDGVDGYVSLEVNPHLAHDPRGTVEEARRLWGEVDRPNLMIKVPATPAGIPAIETLLSEGINVNVTLIFGLAAYAQVMKAYVAGVDRFRSRGGDVRRLASVASFFVSRVDSLVDKRLEALGAEGRPIDALPGKAAIANARLAYAAFERTFGSGGMFSASSAAGARVQRPLWASTSTKNPRYPDTIYVDGLIGPQTVNTLPPATIEAFLDHGRPAVTLAGGQEDARRVMSSLSELGIPIEHVTDQLLAEGVKLFSDSFDELLRNIAQRRRSLARA